jgi:hypothetical protein
MPDQISSQQKKYCGISSEPSKLKKSRNFEFEWKLSFHSKIESSTISIQQRTTRTGMKHFLGFGESLELQQCVAGAPIALHESGIETNAIARILQRIFPFLQVGIGSGSIAVERMEDSR